MALGSACGATPVANLRIQESRWADVRTAIAFPWPSEKAWTLRQDAPQPHVSYPEECGRTFHSSTASKQDDAIEAEAVCEMWRTTILACLSQFPSQGSAAPPEQTHTATGQGLGSREATATHPLPNTSGDLQGQNDPTITDEIHVRFKSIAVSHLAGWKGASVTHKITYSGSPSPPDEGQANDDAYLNLLIMKAIEHHFGAARNDGLGELELVVAVDFERAANTAHHRFAIRFPVFDEVAVVSRFERREDDRFAGRWTPAPLLHQSVALPLPPPRPTLHTRLRSAMLTLAKQILSSLTAGSGSK